MFCKPRIAALKPTHPSVKSEALEPPQWIITARAGIFLILTGSAFVAWHLTSLWGQDKGGLLDMLTSISSGVGIERVYLTGLAALGSGLCVAAGALIEGTYVTVLRRG